MARREGWWDEERAQGARARAYYVRATRLPSGDCVALSSRAARGALWLCCSTFRAFPRVRDGRSSIGIAAAIMRCFCLRFGGRRRRRRRTGRGVGVGVVGRCGEWLAVVVVVGGGGWNFIFEAWGWAGEDGWGWVRRPLGVVVTTMACDGTP